ncbi:MAG: hypothetical protein QM709_01220 [Spongiibacteraceae bacterium]
MRPVKLLVAATALAIASTAALAEPPQWREQRRDERSGDRRAVRDVVGEVEQNYRGHVVDVQPPRSNEDMYRVRVLQEGGRVKTLHVPAKRDKERGR